MGARVWEGVTIPAFLQSGPPNACASGREEVTPWLPWFPVLYTCEGALAGREEVEEVRGSHPLTIKAADWKDDMKLWPPLQEH